MHGPGHRKASPGQRHLHQKFAEIVQLQEKIGAKQAKAREQQPEKIKNREKCDERRPY
jgi:hypothetical protein